MARGSFNFFELHAEKFVLGAAGLFALAMGWLYLIGSPNTVEFDSQEVGPRDLDAQIARAAERLDTRIRTAKSEVATIPKFSEALRREQTAGIFAQSEGSVAVPETLKLAAGFGKAISVPGLEEDSEAAGQIALVTPLAPSAPVVRTGRSVVIQAAPTIPGLETGEKESKPDKPDKLDKSDKSDKARKAEKATEGTELPWVSVAVYFDKKAQQDEMSKAHYAPYRTKVDVAGVDVERQEMQANGEFSDWRDVPPSKATVGINIPDPVVDDRTNAVVNKEAIDRAFSQVKNLQQYIMQPPFYEVEVGDHWEVPPLEGLGDDESAAGDKTPDTETAKKKALEEKRAEKKRQDEAKKGSKGPRGGAGPAVAGEGPRGGARGGIGTEGAVGGAGPRGGGAPPPSASSGKAEAKKQALEDLKQAQAALGDKEYSRALDLANRVKSNTELDGGTIKRAEKLAADAEKKLKEKGGGTGGFSMEGEFGPRSMGGPGGGRGMPGPRGALSGVMTESHALVTHPKKPAQPAVWFHDDSVQPGKTYRYRMRVKLYNRYVGQPKPLRDATGAMHTVLVGEWSLPSEPVSVTPSTHFFVNSAKPDKSGARIDVYKWRQGAWIKKSFDVSVGDIIGGTQKVKTDDTDDKGKPVYEEIDFSTGAVVLDLRFDEPVDLRTAAGKSEFNYRPRPSLIMVYLEPADGQVKERILDLDKNDPLRKELEEKS